MASSVDERSDAPRRGRPLAPALIALVAVVCLAADQLTKWLVVTHLVRGEFVRVCPFLKLRHAYNTGVAFGMWAGGGKLLPIVAALCIITVFVWGSRYARQSALVGWALALVGGGALGNMVDRVRLGHVTDFIDFGVWPVFNVADSCVVVGAILLLIHGLLHHDPKAAPTASPDPEEDA